MNGEASLECERLRFEAIICDMHWVRLNFALAPILNRKEGLLSLCAASIVNVKLALSYIYFEIPLSTPKLAWQLPLDAPTYFLFSAQYFLLKTIPTASTHSGLVSVQYTFTLSSTLVGCLRRFLLAGMSVRDSGVPFLLVLSTYRSLCGVDL